MSNIQIYYRGNPNLKRAYVPVDYTKEQVEELAKCAADPIYFIRNYVKIVNVDGGVIPFDLYDFQQDLIQTYLDERFVIAKFPRQVGKTQTTVAYLLWKVLFNPSYAIAVLAHKLTTAREILDRFQRSYEHIPFWMQQGILEGGWNKTSISLENGSRVIVAATTDDAIRGFSFNLVLLDEFAMVPTSIAEAFFTSVLPVISSGKTTQLFVLSTPKGMNHFFHLWNDAVAGKSGFVAKSVHWSAVPGRDADWEISQRSKLKSKFAQEHECEFLGSSNTLISAEALQRTILKAPIWESDDMRVFEEPKVYDPDDEGSTTHTYVITVDTSEAAKQDYHAFSVIDITDFPYKQVARFRSNTMSYQLMPNIIYDTAKKYNDAYVLIESQSTGFAVADILWQELEYDNILRTTQSVKTGQMVSSGHKKNAKLGVKTTSPVKAVGCSTLKTLIENNQFLFFDDETFQEFTTFVSNGKSYAAEPGAHDDIVMTLVLFAWLTSQQYFRDLTSYSLRRKLYEENQATVEEELIPFGIIDNGLAEEVEVDVDGTMWFNVTDDDARTAQFFDLDRQDMSAEDFRDHIRRAQRSFPKSKR